MNEGVRCDSRSTNACRQKIRTSDKSACSAGFNLLRSSRLMTHHRKGKARKGNAKATQRPATQPASLTDRRSERRGENGLPGEDWTTGPDFGTGLGLLMVEGVGLDEVKDLKELKDEDEKARQPGYLSLGVVVAVSFERGKRKEERATKAGEASRPDSSAGSQSSGLSSLGFVKRIRLPGERGRQGE
ncbi:unnamed protein product [Calypogeia fissa]